MVDASRRDASYQKPERGNGGKVSAEDVHHLHTIGRTRIYPYPAPASPPRLITPGVPTGRFPYHRLSPGLTPGATHESSLRDGSTFTPIVTCLRSGGRPAASPTQCTDESTTRSCS